MEVRRVTVILWLTWATRTSLPTGPWPSTASIVTVLAGEDHPPAIGGPLLTSPPRADQHLLPSKRKEKMAQKANLAPPRVPVNPLPRMETQPHMPMESPQPLESQVTHQDLAFAHPALKVCPWATHTKMASQEAYLEPFLPDLRW